MSLTKFGPPTFLKFGVLLLIFSWPHLSWSWAITLSLFLTWLYQYLIALVCGVHAMPSMDAACFIAKDTALINFISVTTIERHDFELLVKRARGFIEAKEKLRYSVERIFGDYYWKDNADIGWVIDKTMRKIPKDLKDERDLEKFINEQINKPIPLDHP